MAPKLAWLAHRCLHRGCNNGTNVQLCVGPARLPPGGGLRVYHGRSPVTLAGLEGFRLAGALGCKPVCMAGFVPGTHVHTPGHGCLSAGPTREVAFHGRRTQGGRECSLAGGASHQLWCCSGGKSIQMAPPAAAIVEQEVWRHLANSRVACHTSNKSEHWWEGPRV